MKCYICDATISNDDIKHTPEYERGGFAPCGHCNEVINNVFEHQSEEEIGVQIENEIELIYYEGGYVEGEKTT